MSLINIIIEQHDPNLIKALSPHEYNVYELDKVLNVKGNEYECYCEYLHGQHMIVCHELDYVAFSMDMFWISTRDYIYASEDGWQHLKVTK